MSSEALDKAYATQIANIEKTTGKKLEEWIAIVNKSGLEKHGELVSFLKEKHVELAPKKAYVSLRRKKQFAIIQPSTKDRLDIGLNIKGVAPSGNVIASGSWNAMCTHRIKVEDEKMINKDLFNWIKQAYDQAS